MAVNLSSLSNITTSATALSNLILVNPQKNIGYQPQQKILPDGSVTEQDPTFLFDYEDENSVLLENDITDHFVEDNTAIQDQIALKPELITVRGYIAEVNDIVPPLLAPLKAIVDKLTVINAYTPKLSATAILLYNEAVQAYAIANLALSAGVSAWTALTGGSGPIQNKQQTAYDLFFGYREKRTLFTIQTPWAIFENCAIKSLRAIQGADTRMVSEFEVTFKVMKFASTQTVSAFELEVQARLKAQAAGLFNNGISTPPPAPVTFGSQINGITPGTAVG